MWPAGTRGCGPRGNLGVHTLRVGPGPPAPSIPPSQAPSRPNRLCPATRMSSAFLPGESRFSKTQLPRPMVAASHPYLQPLEPRVQRLAPCAYQIPAALIALRASDPVGEGGVQVSRSLGAGALCPAGAQRPRVEGGGRCVQGSLAVAAAEASSPKTLHGLEALLGMRTSRRNRPPVPVVCRVIPCQLSHQGWGRGSAVSPPWEGGQEGVFMFSLPTGAQRDWLLAS